MHTPAQRITAWLAAMPVDEQDTLARRHAAGTSQGGAVVHKPDGQIVPIPPILTPETIEADLRREMTGDAHHLLRALGRLTAWLMADNSDSQHARTHLFTSFSPLEQAGLAIWRHAARLATTRVDYFFDTAGRPRALEVNATIPAMQGYSDIVAASFLQVVGQARGLPPATIAHLCAENGRNSDDLLLALSEHFDRFTAEHAPQDRPRDRRPLKFAIVARHGDAQVGELRHYVARFTELGHDVQLCHPESIRRDGNHLTVDGARVDFIYRHIFARRLAIDSELAQALLRPDVYPIFNPISSHFEVKGMLGHLSAAVAPDGAASAARIGLGDDELQAIARSLPWTRVLDRRPSYGPGGEPMRDLAHVVAGEPERFVIKRSWDYGGKSVFVGPGFDDADARRAGEVMERPHALSWPELVADAAADPRDAWVVQEFVRTPPRRHLLAQRDGATWHDYFVDLSLYTNLGVTALPSGGASRASASRIVNILGGGGLAPLIREQVLTQLLDSTP